MFCDRAELCRRALQRFIQLLLLYMNATHEVFVFPTLRSWTLVQNMFEGGNTHSVLVQVMFHAHCVPWSQYVVRKYPDTACLFWELLLWNMR